MKTVILTFLLLTALSSCDFNKSVKKNLVSGLTAYGDGLSCENVYLSVNGEKITRNSLIYGEEFYVNFNNIEGFKKENENVFPDMRLFVLNKTGDTVFQTNDLCSEFADGINKSPLLLTANLTVAAPIHSNNQYTLYVKIRDKKGTGTYTAKFDFRVNPGELIKIDGNKVTYNELYLFSRDRDKVILDNKIRFDEDIYLLFEGLKGFREENGKVFPGLGIKAFDNDGKTILEESDLFGGYTETGITTSDFNSQVLSKFKFTGSEVKNPINCEVTIWDKKSDAKIKATINLILE